MKASFIILLSIISLVSCRHSHGLVGGPTDYMHKPSSKVISDIGIPAEISLSMPFGPFQKPTQTLTYYSKNEDGRILPYHFWIQEELVISHSGHPDGARKIIAVNSDEGITSIIKSKRSAH